MITQLNMRTLESRPNGERRGLFAGKPAALLAAAVAAFSLAGCVNYAGIKSDKKIESPSTYETKQSLPDQGG
ncbi:MarR family transcriptional regulator, partial [Paraburkholderia sp. SIMBA_050]